MMTSLTVTVPIRHDLDFTRITASTMVTLHRLQYALVEESVLFLCRALAFEVVQPDVKRLACDRVSVRSGVALLTGLWSQ